ncbi:MAG TPA: hypothetical protein VFD90_03120 [Gaiellales bacterium]|nr:hypothetical protein [Gaiellales bacterium]
MHAPNPGALAYDGLDAGAREELRALRAFVPRADRRWEDERDGT